MYECACICNCVLSPLPSLHCLWEGGSSDRCDLLPRPSVTRTLLWGMTPGQEPVAVSTSTAVVATSQAIPQRPWGQVDRLWLPPIASQGLTLRLGVDTLVLQLCSVGISCILHSFGALSFLPCLCYFLSFKPKISKVRSCHLLGDWVRTPPRCVLYRPLSAPL